jgi:peptidase M48-like protein
MRARNVRTQFASIPAKPARNACATCPTNPLAAIVLMATLFALPQILSAAPPAPAKMKLRGYVTDRIDTATVAILDDHIQLAKGGRVELSEGTTVTSTAPAPSFATLAPGQLVEAEGIWEGKHRFSAERITIEPGLLDKSLHETAYLQEEPSEGTRIAVGEAAELKVDGEWLTIGPKTHRDWPSAVLKATSAGSGAGGSPDAQSGPSYAGRQVRYAGIRREDGRVETHSVELGDAAPPDAYKLPHDEKIIAGKDAQTGIPVLEFHRGSKIDGRMKLFAVPEVQQYVADLGASLLPAGAMSTTKPIEFRFFVVEDPSINAAALRDGTVLVNTGLLGAVQNEAELAFVLAHETAHVLQAHDWREANETRGAKVALVTAAVVGTVFVGDTAIFLSGLGMAAVVNGHQRSLENQADRLGLQTIIDKGYDPREATKMMRIFIEHYGDRTTSKLWSNHDSSVMRGSFLVVQLAAQYPQGHFDGARVDTQAFQDMREAMGPVKIE